MRRLVLYSAILFAILLTATVGALMVGAALPIPASIIKFHLRDCESPCWMGITPGKTSREEAQERVSSLLRSFRGYVYENQTFRYNDLRLALRDPKRKGQTVIDVTCLTRDEIVNSCAIGWSPDLDEGVPTLSELQNILGKPERISWTPGLITQYYGDMYRGTALLALADWTTPTDRLNLNAKALGIVFFSSTKPVVPDVVFRPWRGFTIAARYVESGSR